MQNGIFNSAYKDVQGHVQDIFDGSFRCKDSLKCRQSLRRYFHLMLQQSDEETKVISLSRRKLEKIKQKERKRLPAHVTNVGMPLAKNIE